MPTDQQNPNPHKQEEEWQDYSPLTDNEKILMDSTNCTDFKVLALKTISVQLISVIQIARKTLKECNGDLGLAIETLIDQQNESDCMLSIVN